MAYETVLVEKSDHVATITLNRPESLNAFNELMRTELSAAMEEVEEDAEIRCVVLTGAGRAFSAGADVKGWEKNIREIESAAEPPSPLVPPSSRRYHITGFIMGMSKPVIAAINGPCVGMGSTIMVGCDLRVASEAARISFTFVKRGLTPELGSTYLFPRLVGYGTANDLFLTGRFVDAKEAKEIGLVNAVYPAESFMDSVMGLARSIAANPPIAVKFIKKGMSISLESTWDTMLQFEHWAIATCRQSEDYKEGVRAFLEKRQPVFKGR